MSLSGNAPLRRRALLALPLIVLARPAPGGTGATAASELVMFVRPGCSWCMRWDLEIAPIYPRTAEGRAAPLRRVDLSAAGTETWLAAPVRYTPTFVLRAGRSAHGGHERGRITGYAGEAAFWGILGTLLGKGTS